MSTLKTISIIMALLCAAVLWADPRSNFDEGLRLYRSNELDGAIKAWEGVIRQGVVSGDLLYNLGNAYYKSGQIGKAVISYERALKLIPRDRDVRNNLELTKLAIVDKIDAPVRLMIWDWADSIRNYLTSRELAGIFYVLGFLSAGILIVLRFGPLTLRSFARVILLVCLACYGIFGAWYAWRALYDTKTFGIVMAAKSDACSAPDASSKQLFSLHEGTKVQCGELLSGWLNIRLADGRNGWVPLQDLEKI